MKLACTLVILASWSKLSLASDASEFLNDVDETKFFCQNNILSINFINAVIIQIGRDFISSSLITCLDLRNNQIQTIADGAFQKLPKLEKLFLSNNKFSSGQNLFTLGGHETLEVLTLNSAITYIGSAVYVSRYITIPGSYPNLKILSVRNNGFNDITASTQKPFPKLKILDLSGNNMASTNFVKLLPSSLEHIYLHDNSFTTLRSLGEAKNVTTLTLDNNKFAFLNYLYPAEAGLWLHTFHNLRYLSLAGNRIRFVYSDFSGPNNLAYLNLSRNEIGSVSLSTFAKLQHLETLDLSENKLHAIINISAVINVTTLLLSSNKIHTVPANAFQQMPKLQELSLKANQIEKVDVNGFTHLNYLENLDLSDNKLSSLPEGWTGGFDSLKLLDLSENQFTSLVSLSLSNTLPLVEVYLVMNPLKYVDGASFNNLPKNVTVNLAHRLDEDNTKR